MSAGRDDLRVALSLPGHLKIRRLVKACGDHGFACLIRLWCYVGQNRPDGVLREDEPVEAVSEWTGTPGLLLSTLTDLRLVEADGLTIHDWADEQPWIAGRDGRIEAARESGRRGGVERAKTAERNSNGTFGPPKGQPGVALALDQGSAKGIQTPLPSPPLTTPPEEQSQIAAPKRAARVVSPQEAAAKRLADSLGSSINPCRKQVSALLASGWDLARVESAIDAHAQPGIAPWDWTKAARGVTPNGKTSADDRILASLRANQQMHENHKEQA